MYKIKSNWLLYVIQLSDRVYNVTFSAYALYSLRRTDLTIFLLNTEPNCRINFFFIFFFLFVSFLFVYFYFPFGFF